MPKGSFYFEFLRDEVVGFGYARGCLLGNFGTEIIDHSESIRASVQAGMQQWADLLRDALTEAHQAGTVRAELDPDATARFLLNAWKGTLIQARAEKSSAAFDAFFTVAFGVLLQ